MSAFRAYTAASAVLSLSWSSSFRSGEPGPGSGACRHWMPWSTSGERLLQIGRYDLNAVALPDHYNLGTDNLPFVIREHCQLALNQ